MMRPNKTGCTEPRDHVSVTLFSSVTALALLPAGCAKPGSGGTAPANLQNQGDPAGGFVPLNSLSWDLLVSSISGLPL
jgi:hypothetical protein